MDLLGVLMGGATALSGKRAAGTGAMPLRPFPSPSPPPRLPERTHGPQRGSGGAMIFRPDPPGHSVDRSRRRDPSPTAPRMSVPFADLRPWSPPRPFSRTTQTPKTKSVAQPHGASGPGGSPSNAIVPQRAIEHSGIDRLCASGSESIVSRWYSTTCGSARQGHKGLRQAAFASALRCDAAVSCRSSSQSCVGSTMPASSAAVLPFRTLPRPKVLMLW